MPPGTLADLPVERFERLERAILGDSDVGHLGAIQRLNIVDADHARIPELHQKIEERRTDGDRRLHARLDDHIARLDEQRESDRVEREADREADREERARIEKKIDRLWWMLIGSTTAGFAVGWGVSGAPLPSP